MADLTKLHKMLDWRLLESSHDFPGPDGGTCINEAAVVAAGFEYRSIAGPRDFPPCFSVPLGLLLLQVNDSMDDEERQLLMPFVLRLAGSKASSKTEAHRIAFICGKLVKIIDGALNLVEGAWKREKTSDDDCRDGDGVLLERRGNIEALGKRNDRATQGGNLGELICDKEFLSALDEVGRNHQPGYASGDYLRQCIAVIERAFEIGNKTPPLAVSEIRKRFEATKKAAAELENA